MDTSSISQGHKRRNHRRVAPLFNDLSPLTSSNSSNLSSFELLAHYSGDMSTLNLPKPVNTYAGEDELRQKPNGHLANGASGDVHGESNGDVGDDDDMAEYRPPKPSDKLKAGMIFPPKEIRSEMLPSPYGVASLIRCSAIIDKTANAVSRSPTPLLLEEKIRDLQKTDPKFAFLNPEDPYHQYYRYSIEVIRESADEPKVSATPVPQAAQATEDKVKAYEPKAYEFKVDLPGVTAMDL